MCTSTAARKILILGVLSQSKVLVVQTPLIHSPKIHKIYKSFHRQKKNAGWHGNTISSQRHYLIITQPLFLAGLVDTHRQIGQKIAHINWNLKENKCADMWKIRTSAQMDDLMTLDVHTQILRLQPFLIRLRGNVLLVRKWILLNIGVLVMPFLCLKISLCLH